MSIGSIFLNKVSENWTSPRRPSNSVKHDNIFAKCQWLAKAKVQLDFFSLEKAFCTLKDACPTSTAKEMSEKSVKVNTCESIEVMTYSKLS